MDITLLFLDWVILLVMVRRDLRNISKALAECTVMENSLNKPLIVTLYNKFPFMNDWAIYLLGHLIVFVNVCLYNFSLCIN